MAYQDILKLEEASEYFWSSRRQQNALFERNQFVNNVMTRRRTGYLYCVVCDSQMDTEIMWENHSNGSRHYVNSQNYEYSDDDPSIQEQLNEETRPIAGLDHIYEVMRSNQHAVYQCLLCPAGLLTSESLIEHIMGLAHQLAFLKENVNEKFSRLHSSGLTRSEMEPVVQNIISEYERKHGKGKMFVVKEREGPGFFLAAYKKHRYSDDEQFLPNYASQFASKKPCRYSPTKSDRMEEKKPYSKWKNRPVREESREGRYIAKPYYSDAEVPKSVEPKSPAHVETQDTSSERDSFYNPAWPARYEGGRWKDLRVYLEQKKNIGTTVKNEKSNMEVSTPAPSLSEIKDDSDALFLVDDISSEFFLKLALFKLDKMNVKDATELKLLDRVVKKASALSQKVKKKMLAKSLKEKFRETLYPNSISIQEQSTMDNLSNSNLQFAQHLDNFIGHYKACKTTVSEDEDVSHSCDLKPSDRKKPMSRYQLNDVSADRNIPEIEVVYDSGLNR